MWGALGARGLVLVSVLCASRRVGCCAETNIMRQIRRSHLVLLILCERLLFAVSKSCLSLRGGTKPGCSNKCKVNRARQHCRACICAACAFCEASVVASNHSSRGVGLPTTPPARSTSLVLRTIGYIPAEQLPLEFGGTPSDFTASGSNRHEALMRAEMATARIQQLQLSNQRTSSHKSNRISSKTDDSASSPRKVKLWMKNKKNRKINSRKKGQGSSPSRDHSR